MSGFRKFILRGNVVDLAVAVVIGAAFSTVIQALVKDIAMHVAAVAPTYVSKDDVPAEVLDKEKEIYKAQATAAGKPANVVDKIAEGKVKEYYATFCLLEQPFVKDPKLTVGQLIQEKIALIKENIVVRRFARFRVGEEAAKPSSE